jgi:hypothetical protein
LWIALAAGALGFAGVISCLLLAALTKVERTAVTLSELESAWWSYNKRDRLAPAIRFFRENPKYLGGFDSPSDLREFRERAYLEWMEAVHRLEHATYVDHIYNTKLLTYITRNLRRDPDPRASRRFTKQDAISLENRFKNIENTVSSVLSLAGDRVATQRGQSHFRLFMYSAVIAAIGVVGFSWAANPPAPQSASADLRNARLTGTYLRDVNLRNARLDGADFTGADLTGADLEGASLIGVVWSNTICPDGTDSNANKGTCGAHLS